MRPLLPYKDLLRDPWLIIISRKYLIQWTRPAHQWSHQRRFRQLQDEKANGVDRQNVNNSSRILGQKDTYK